ncbi:MAG: DUF4032 domain-containing protein [Chlamydiae bacterium]|nr:DUF4032 domain-containing protein [Chlamydiota bacterium]
MHMDKKKCIYSNFIDMKDEILRHKWIESEKAGKDIGFEKALVDWVNKHRIGWIINKIK